MDCKNIFSFINKKSIRFQKKIKKVVKPRIFYVPIVSITNVIYELLYYYTAIINIIVNGFDYHYYDYYYYNYIGNEVCLFYIAREIVCN